jgi:hypothetical protein
MDAMLGYGLIAGVLGGAAWLAGGMAGVRGTGRGRTAKLNSAKTRGKTEALA